MKGTESNRPEYLRDCISLIRENHRRMSLYTRYGNLLSIPVYHKSKFQNSFSYLAPSYYNQIPIDIRNLDIKNSNIIKNVSSFVKSNFAQRLIETCIIN